MTITNRILFVIIFRPLFILSIIMKMIGYAGIKLGWFVEDWEFKVRKQDIENEANEMYTFFRKGKED